MRFLSAFACLLLTGCDRGGPVEGCTRDGDCGAGEPCRDGMCIAGTDSAIERRADCS